MRTKIPLPQLAALVPILALSVATAQPKIPPKYHASPDEVAQLPTYCYNQYVDGALGGYKFSIPSESCGYSMNHFCGALVFMIQAQKLSLRKAERVASVQNAIKEVNYTLQDMKPGCFIANDVLAAKERALMLSKIIK